MTAGTDQMAAYLWDISNLDYELKVLGAPLQVLTEGQSRVLWYAE